MSIILFYLYPNVSEYNKCSCTLCLPLQIGILASCWTQKNSAQQTMYGQGAINPSFFWLEKN